MHTVLCLGTNDNVYVFDYYVVNLKYVKSCCIQLLLCYYVVVVFITHRIVTADSI